jgi:hypothetical protein
VQTAERNLDPTWEIARSLAGGEIDALQAVGGGRNSRVYRIESAGRRYALKQYPTRSEDPRDRLGAEAAALTLMERHGIAGVPRLIAANPERGYALLSWLDGVPVTEVGEPDIDAAAAFLAALHALRHGSEIAPDRLASEACLSAAEIVRQLERRLSRLRAAPASETELHAFLDGVFVDALAATRADSSEAMRRAGLDPDAVLPPEQRSLVPSDFGFHNSLRVTDGSLVFFDFEYFGWDDPVKMTADVMLHPGCSLPASLRRRFRGRAQQVYGENPWFRRRLAAYYPLFGLRWVLILLNDFVPGALRRVLAGTPESWHALKQSQLAKAREFLARVRDEQDVWDGE